MEINTSDLPNKVSRPSTRHDASLGAAILTTALALLTVSASGSEVVELKEQDFIVRDSYLYSDELNALKTPTPILDVPQSLSITSAEAISLRGFNSIEDIVAYTPGVNISQGELEPLLAQVRDQALRHTLAFGIGIHHAGLAESDRNLVERLFVDQVGDPHRLRSGRANARERVCSH